MLTASPVSPLPCPIKVSGPRVLQHLSAEEFCQDHYARAWTASILLQLLSSCEQAVVRGGGVPLSLRGVAAAIKGRTPMARAKAELVDCITSLLADARLPPSASSLLGLQCLEAEVERRAAAWQQTHGYHLFTRLCA